MKLRLQVMVSPWVTFAFGHDGPRLVVGREPKCDLPLTAEGAQGVSRKHAQIDLTPYGAFVHDLESVNGTFVNGRRANRPAAFKVGDIIRLGPKGPILGVMGLELDRASRPVVAAAPCRVLAGQRVLAAATAPAGARPHLASAPPSPTASAASDVPPPDSPTRRLVKKLQKRQRWTLVGIAAAALGCLVMGALSVILAAHVSTLAAQNANTKERAAKLAKTASDQKQELTNLKDRVKQVSKQVRQMSREDAGHLGRSAQEAVENRTGR